MIKKKITTVSTKITIFGKDSALFDVSMVVKQ